MQKFNSNTRIIIGVDHGYGNMKTAHRVFRTGVECMEEEPIVSKNFVKYKDKFYVIGESHLVYQGNKTDSEDFYILTFAALAEELKFRGLHEANVTLAAGLPLAWMKSQGADFKRYLMKEQELHFEFRKREISCAFVRRRNISTGICGCCQFRCDVGNKYAGGYWKRNHERDADY